jgi:APA family basic amino acid/polyamine antiporter
MNARATPASIGLVTAIALVVGNMIGSGLFLLPASLAPWGPAALLGWGVSALGALALALVFARLARRWPRSGGPYAFARAAFGDRIGFVVAWSYWVSIWCATAAIAIAFAGYAGALWPEATSTPLRAMLTALAALWLCTLSNALGVRSAGTVQVVTTLLKLLPLVVLVVFAAPSVEAFAWQPFNRSGQGLWTVVSATAALTLWSFLGIECATMIAGDVRDPLRNVPRATMIGTTIAIIVTIAACTVVAGIVPPEALATSGAPFAEAATRLWGTGFGHVFAATAAVACFGALNGWVLMQGQLPLAAARDRVFPLPFARTDAQGTPLVGLLVGSVLASLLVLANFRKDLVGLFTFSILLSTAATLVPFLVCSAAELRQLATVDERGARRAHAPGSIGAGAVAACAFAFSLFALAGTGTEALLWGVVLVAAGIPFYLWARSSKLTGVQHGINRDHTDAP